MASESYCLLEDKWCLCPLLVGFKPAGFIPLDQSYFEAKNESYNSAGSFPCHPWWRLFFFFKPGKDKIMLFSEYLVTGVWSGLKEWKSQFWMWVDHRAFSHIIVYHSIVPTGVLLKLRLKKKYKDCMIFWIFRLCWWTNSPSPRKVCSFLHSFNNHSWMSSICSLVC